MVVPNSEAQSPRKTPSCEDGIDAETEEQLRAYGGGLVLRVGVLLKVPQLTIASAAVIFQRFYYVKSFAEYNVRVGATAAMLLACKLDERPRKLQDVVIASHRVQMRELCEDDGTAMYARRPVPFLDPTGKEYADMHKDVVRAERHMFREVGFDVATRLDHSHKYVLLYLNALGRPAGVAQQAWNYVNDALRTTLCCTYRPQQIATASIFLAARAVAMKLPMVPKPWWEAIGADAQGLHQIARAMLAVYHRPAAGYIHIPRIKRSRTSQEALAETQFPETPAPIQSPSPEEEDPYSALNKVAAQASMDSIVDREDNRLEDIPAENASMVPNAAPNGNKRCASFEDKNGSAMGNNGHSDKIDCNGESVREKDKTGDGQHVEARDRADDNDRDRGNDKDRRRLRDKERERHEVERERFKEKAKEKVRDKDRDKEKERDKERDKRKKRVRSPTPNDSSDSRRGKHIKISRGSTKEKCAESSSESMSNQPRDKKSKRRKRRVRSEDV